MPTMKSAIQSPNKVPKYDLEERLLEFAVNVIRFVEKMHKTDAGKHVSGREQRPWHITVRRRRLNPTRTLSTR